MSIFTLNILDIFDITYANFIEPNLDSWGVITLYNNLSMYIEDSIYAALAALSVKQTIVEAVVFTLKFITLIALLVFIRGGIPRYRYDFLTKIG